MAPKFWRSWTIMKGLDLGTFFRLLGFWSSKGQGVFGLDFWVLRHYKMKALIWGKMQNTP
jgi:hypothetical protein